MYIRFFVSKHHSPVKNWLKARDLATSALPAAGLPPLWERLSTSDFRSIIRHKGYLPLQVSQAGIIADNYIIF